MSKGLKIDIAKRVLQLINKDAHLYPKFTSNIQVYGDTTNNFFVECNNLESEIRNINTQSLISKNKILDVFNDDTSKSPSSIKMRIDKNHFVGSILNEIVFVKTTVPHEPKKVVIDFSSPNIAKPFHVGHLRSTIIGNFIAKVNSYLQEKVTKVNYLGDWGTQIGLLKVGLDLKGISMQNVNQQPIETLTECYVQANQIALEDETIQKKARDYFQRLENGDSGDLNNWKSIRGLTVTELSKVYKRLGIEFDVYSWESDYNYMAIKNILVSLEDKGILKNSENGTKVVNVNDSEVTLLKSDNSTLYLTREIAAVIDRYDKFTFDEMIFVVENGQNAHFSALIDILRQMKLPFAENCNHVKFGRIKGMSTRRGTSVSLQEVLDKAKDKMHEKQLKSRNTRAAAMNENVCDILGTTAVIINDLKQRRVANYTFDWDKALQSEGDSGIKLQYLHCKLWSLEQNSGAVLPNTCDPRYISEPEALSLIEELAHFEDVISKSRRESEACVIVNYLFRLARKINVALKVLRVKNESTDVASQRLLLFHASRLVLKQCLELLGVRPLNEM